MLNQTSIIAGILLLIIGVINCFFGYKLFKIILPVSVLIVSGYLVGSVVYTLTSSQEAGVAVGLIAGIILAVLSVVFYYMGVFLIGAGLGGVIAFSIQLPVDELTRLGLIAALIIAGGVLGLVLQKYMIIVATSFIGAYLLLNGLLYTGYYLNGSVMTLKNYYYSITANVKIYSIMLILSILIGLAGIVIQYKVSDRKDG